MRLLVATLIFTLAGSIALPIASSIITEEWVIGPESTRFYTRRHDPKRSKVWALYWGKNKRKGGFNIKSRFLQITHIFTRFTNFLEVSNVV
jgi:hypothetical protein